MELVLVKNEVAGTEYMKGTVKIGVLVYSKAMRFINHCAKRFDVEFKLKRIGGVVSILFDVELHGNKQDMLDCVAYLKSEEKNIGMY